MHWNVEAAHTAEMLVPLVFLQLPCRCFCSTTRRMGFISPAKRNHELFQGPEMFRAAPIFREGFRMLTFKARWIVEFRSTRTQKVIWRLLLKRWPAEREILPGVIMELRDFTGWWGQRPLALEDYSNIDEQVVQAEINTSFNIIF